MIEFFGPLIYFEYLVVGCKLDPGGGEILFGGGGSDGGEGPDGAAVGAGVALQDLDGLLEPLVRLLGVGVEAHREFAVHLKNDEN